MAKQNLQSWFWDMSLPSPQVAGLLNKATFPFPTNTCLSSIGFQALAAKPEFSNRINLPFTPSSALS